MTSRGMIQRNLDVSNVYWKTWCFDIKTDELEGPESSRTKTSLMKFITVYLLFVLPLPLTLATGAVSFISPFDVAYYERHCQHYFSIDCPVHDHDSWLCSKIITNCSSPDYPYHCILNTAGKVVHVCAVAQICPKGTVPIFDPRTHMVSCKNCSKGYYQPVDIWSNNTPVCMEKFGCDINYHKIECTVEPEKEQTQDTLCRCDAHNDYILSFSEGREICVPGKFADCFKLKCPDGQERLLDYTCAPRCEEGFQRDDSDLCVPNSTVSTTTEGDKTTQTSTASTENFSKGSISENDVIIATSVIFPSLAIILIIALFHVTVSHTINKQNVKFYQPTDQLSYHIVYWKRRVCSRQFNPVPTIDNDANTYEDVSTNNDTNGNAVSRERPNQVPTDDNAMELMLMNNAPNDVQEPRTLSNGTNTNAQPRDIPDWERPSPDKLHQTVLNRCLPVLIRDLNFTVVKIYIQQKEIFDDVTIRDIMEQTTTTEAISMLIEKLKQKPQDKYEEFKECLVLAGQEDLKNMLEEVEEKITKEIGETHQAQDTVNASLDMDISPPGNSLDAV